VRTLRHYNLVPKCRGAEVSRELCYYVRSETDIVSQVTHMYYRCGFIWNFSRHFTRC